MAPRLGSWVLLVASYLCGASEVGGASSPGVSSVEIGPVVRRLKLEDRFVGATMDWWPDSKESPNPGAHLPWIESSILRANLSNPTLASAAKMLAPFVLRIGGSLADQVVYEESCDGLGFVSDGSSYNGFGYGGGCVTFARVHEVLDWCLAVGCEVAFGLHQGGPPPGGASLPRVTLGVVRARSPLETRTTDRPETRDGRAFSATRSHDLQEPGSAR